MGYKMNGHALPGIKQKPVTKKPKTEGKEINIKTNSSKLYGLDWKGFEPSVEPSFAATSEGSKKRAESEKAHEAREDAQGK
jgi:hypothetical protein